MSVFPDWYYYYFLIETVMGVIGFIGCLLAPTSFTSGLLRPGVEPSTNDLGETIRGRYYLASLGTMTMYSGVVVWVLFPFVKNDLAHLPKLQEKLMTRWEVADVTVFLIYIACQFYTMPPDLRFSPSKWTKAFMGCIIMPTFFLSIRTMYILGIARDSVSTSSTFLGRLKDL